MSQQGAVVTGAGRGLGKQIARLLAERGHRVLVTDVDAVTAQAAAEEIGHGATAMAVDVRDRSQVDAAREHIVETAGRLSVWVNNAGVRFTGPDWEQGTDAQRLDLGAKEPGTSKGTATAADPRPSQGGAK